MSPSAINLSSSDSLRIKFREHSNVTTQEEQRFPEYRLSNKNSIENDFHLLVRRFDKEIVEKQKLNNSFIEVSRQLDISRRKYLELENIITEVRKLSEKIARERDRMEAELNASISENKALTSQLSAVEAQVSIFIYDH
jgi:seryl-tRNA synthetase